MLKHPENIKYEQVQEALSKLDKEDQSLAALAYGTGARVSELNQITKKDCIIDNETNYLKIYCLVLKKRSLKRIERMAVIRLDETWLVTPILNKVNSLSKPDDFLFPFHRATIFRKLKKVIIAGESINPHGFRKLRATHLHSVFGFDAYQLKSFFEWKDISPSSSYVGIDKKEILY
jgi:integrase